MWCGTAVRCKALPPHSVDWIQLGLSVRRVHAPHLFVWVSSQRQSVSSVISWQPLQGVSLPPVHLRPWTSIRENEWMHTFPSGLKQETVIYRFDSCTLHGYHLFFLSAISIFHINLHKHTVLWMAAWSCLCLPWLPKTCFIITMYFDQLYQLQLVKSSWGSWKRRGRKIVDLLSPIPSSLSLSVSLVEINCSFYIRKQSHSWSAVTFWLILRAIRFIIIVINYHLVPRWPALFGVPSVGFHAGMGFNVI